LRRHLCADLRRRQQPAEVASMSIFELLHADDVEHARAGFEITLVGQPALRFFNRYRCASAAIRSPKRSP
jgi:hypothetical protein